MIECDSKSVFHLEDWTLDAMVNQYQVKYAFQESISFASLADFDCGRFHSLSLSLGMKMSCGCWLMHGLFLSKMRVNLVQLAELG